MDNCVGDIQDDCIRSNSERVGRVIGQWTILGLSVFCCFMPGAQEIEAHLGHMTVFVVWEDEACAPHGYGANSGTRETGSGRSNLDRRGGACESLAVENVLEAWSERPSDRYVLRYSANEVRLPVKGRLRDAVNRTAEKCRTGASGVGGGDTCIVGAAVFLFELSEGVEVQFTRGSSRDLGDWSDSAEALPTQGRWITHCAARAIAPMNGVPWTLIVDGRSLSLRFVNP